MADVHARGIPRAHRDVPAADPGRRAPTTSTRTWLGLKLTPEHTAEFQQRLYELVNEFKERGPDADGDTYSFFSTLHPDDNPPAAH